MPRTKRAVSEKSTKNEILEAYHQLLAEAGRGEDSGEAAQDKAVVDAAAKETVEKITQDLTSLKLSFNQTTSQFTERLTQEAERLATLLKAISIAEKELSDVQQIKVRAGMLQRMIELQKQKEEEFAKAIEERQRQWEEEQKEYEGELKKTRDREEDEYRYQRELAKKRDTAELRELEDLRKRVVAFPMELEKAVKDAVGKALAEAKKEADIQKQITDQESKSELRLKQTQTETLEMTVKNQTAEINRLRTQLEESTRQVKDIAVAVIEGPKKESASLPDTSN